MSADWPRFTVAELQAARHLLVEDGNHGEYRPRSEEFATAGVSFIRAADMDDGRVLFESAACINNVARARIRKGVGRPGDVLLSHKGTVGKVALVPERCPDYVCSPQTTFWRVLDESILDRAYLFAYLQSQEFKDQLASRKGETDMADYVSLTAQRQLTVPLPPLKIQRSIGVHLSMLSNRIALLRETNATLEAIALALFKSWFVDFDPVRAKQQGLVPLGMDEPTAALFPATYEEWQAQASRPAVSDMIASGWLLIGDGYRAKNNELGRPGVPFVRAGDLDAGQITPTKDYLAEPAVRAASTKMAKPGDTAFTSKGTIGRFAFVDTASGEAVYSPQVCFWRSLRTDIVEPAYLHYWMKSAAFKVQVDAVRGQAAIMDYVSLADQRRMRLDIPPIRVQKRFAEIAQVIIEQISCNRSLATYLTSVRDSLLPRLISGQLRLTEVATQTTDVLT
ncbi:MAG: restriction endonuclease subunit S [Burkholderiales bacterium]|nr:restriction endonuclease subunit S [Burkholderiales bacterium]